MGKTYRTLIVYGRITPHVDYYLRKYGGVPVKRLGGYVMGDPCGQGIGLGPCIEMNGLNYRIDELDENPDYIVEDPLEIERESALN